MRGVLGHIVTNTILSTKETDLCLDSTCYSVDVIAHMSVRSVVRVVTHTHTQTDDVKTNSPDTSQMWGVNIHLHDGLLHIATTKTFRRF